MTERMLSIGMAISQHLQTRKAAKKCAQFQKWNAELECQLEDGDETQRAACFMHATLVAAFVPLLFNKPLDLVRLVEVSTI